MVGSRSRSQKMQILA